MPLRGPNGGFIQQKPFHCRISPRSVTNSLAGIHGVTNWPGLATSMSVEGAPERLEAGGRALTSASPLQRDQQGQLPLLVSLGPPFRSFQRMPARPRWFIRYAPVFRNGRAVDMLRFSV